MNQADVNKLNLNSPEGKMFNAAMAILTTEYKPDMEFGKMFDKVKALADQLPDSESPTPEAYTKEDMAEAWNAGYGNCDGRHQLDFEEWLPNYKPSTDNETPKI